MDIISNSIQLRRHIYTFQYKCEQTWSYFNKIKSGKQIVIYGAGGGLRYLIRSKPEIGIQTVIDSNPSYNGKTLGDIHEEFFLSDFAHLSIHDRTYLEKCLPDHTIILITNVKAYEAVSKYLEEQGFSNIFVMLLMECNDVNRKKVVAPFPMRDSYLEHTKDISKYIVQNSNVENKIVFSIGVYGGHAKVITQELLKKNCEYEIVWLVNDMQTEHPEEVHLVKNEWWLALYELETASIWVYDVMVPQYCIKREGQTYIQTKHWSSLTLKRFYLEDGDTCKSDTTQQEIRQNAKWMDIVFSGSTIDEETCRSGFGVGNIFKRIGSPRSDILFRSGIKEKVYRQYGIPATKKCIVYAPTFRSAELFQGKKVVMELDIIRLLMECEQKFGSEWVLLLRLHPIIAEKNKDISLGDNVISVSDYPDSQELMAAADILITDYSSLMFEPAYVGKKVFLYAPDRDAYIEKERTLIFDYDSLPFPVAETNDELINCIHIFDEEKYQERLSAFMEKYEVREDGHASERAADMIMELLEGK